MLRMRTSLVVIVHAALSCVFLTARMPALADGQLSALPQMGSSQTFSASQSGAMNAGGTFTVARISSDSVHVTQGNGLATVDQTLSIDGKGSVAQTSPANPFIDLLNTLTAILAAAPSTLQKNAQWTATISAMSAMESAAGAYQGAPQMQHAPKSPPINVAMTTKLVSVNGDVLTFHSEGTEKQQTSTIGGTLEASVTITIDFELKTGHLRSCSRTTATATGFAANPMTMNFTTSLNPQ